LTRDSYVSYDDRVNEMAVSEARDHLAEVIERARSEH